MHGECVVTILLEAQLLVAVYGPAAEVSDHYAGLARIIATVNEHSLDKVLIDITAAPLMELADQVEFIRRLAQAWPAGVRLATVVGDSPEREEHLRQCLNLKFAGGLSEASARNFGTRAQAGDWLGLDTGQPVNV